MKIVIFGLSISSSWGNGHATLWRGLCSALAKRGHDVVFFERDLPYFAQHRDLEVLPKGKLILYSDWADVQKLAWRHLAQADVAIATSYCPDAVAAERLMMDAPALPVFYDLDTPVTLHCLRSGQEVAYLGPHHLSRYELVLSYTGGKALTALKEELGARQVAPLYGSVDPEIHHPVPPSPTYVADLSYLGTYAEDRQETLNELFLKPAAARPQERFTLAGAQYPDTFPWKPNLYFFGHLPPPEHAPFFSSSRLTLNVTRGAMARLGYCPSGRLFEAAASGAVLLSDEWEGIGSFFEIGSEIITAAKSDDTLAAMELTDAELRKIAQAARERVFAEHTAAHRARELEKIVTEHKTSPAAGVAVRM